jgi:polyferredoxin
LGNLGLLRIRRDEANCKGCAVCNAPCPLKLDVAKADPAVSADCLGCLECVDVCPRHGALNVTFGPAVPRVFRLNRSEKEDSAA